MNPLSGITPSGVRSAGKRPIGASDGVFAYSGRQASPDMSSWIMDFTQNGLRLGSSKPSG